MVSLKSIISSSGLNLVSELTLAHILTSLIITFILALFIFYIYKKTYSGVLYSKNFNIALVMASLISAMILLAISGSLALALGMLGALSIIRFRTAIKDPRDVIFLFWAIAIGIVSGIGIYKLSIISSLFIGVVVFVMSKRIRIKHSYLVNIKATKDVNITDILNIFKLYCSKYKLRSTTITDNEKEILIEIRVKKDRETIVTKELSKIGGVKKLTVFSHEGDLEE